MIHPPPPRHSRMTSTLAQMGMGLGSVSTAAAGGAVGSGSAVTGMGGASVGAGDGSSGTSSLMVVLQVFGETGPPLNGSSRMGRLYLIADQRGQRGVEAPWIERGIRRL